MSNPNHFRDQVMYRTNRKYSGVRRRFDTSDDEVGVPEGKNSVLLKIFFDYGEKDKGGYYPPK